MSSVEITTIPHHQATEANIRAVEDGPVNPFTGKEWTPKHKKLLQGRRKLPVYKHLGPILAAYHQSRFVVLSSDTGSGKSTQIPQFILYDEWASKKRVVCTQPRRLAATSLATRVAQEMDITVGQEVGFVVRGERAVTQGVTRVEYMTEGVLLAEFMTDKKLSKIGCVIIDDAHERNCDTDMLLALLKKASRSRMNSDFQVIIMSATLNAAIFQQYFKNCPIVQVPGKSYKVDVCYLASNQELPKVMIAAAQTVLSIHQKMPSGHILVFAPGQKEIVAIIDFIRKANKEIQVRPLFSQLPGSKQQITLDSTGPRQCIVATNIAEASLTIDGIVYVVDTGISKQQVYNPRLGMNDLRTQWISQASANQRKGRAGRTQDGTCFRLYTKAAFEAMPPFTEPKIRLQALDSTLLKLASVGVYNFVDFDWLTPPPPECLARSAQNLRDWGFLGDDNRPNHLGRHASLMPFEPIWYRALLEAQKFDCLTEMITLTAICTDTKSVFKSPSDFRIASEQMREAWKGGYNSDHIALLVVWDAYITNRAVKVDGETDRLYLWCEDHHLDMDTLERIVQSRWRLVSQLQGSQIFNKHADKPLSMTKLPQVLRALATAFCTQLAIIQTSPDIYMTVYDGVTALVEPNSAALGSDSEWIVYNSLQKSGGRVHFDVVSPVKPEWLVDLPYFAVERATKSWDGKDVRHKNVQASIARARAQSASASQQ